MKRWIKAVFLFVSEIWTETFAALGQWFWDRFYDFHRDQFYNLDYHCAKLLLRVALIIAAIGLWWIAICGE